MRTARIIGMNLSELHSNMESSGVIHAQELWQKRYATHYS